MMNQELHILGSVLTCYGAYVMYKYKQYVTSAPIVKC